MSTDDLVVSDIHFRLIEQYRRANPWSSPEDAAAATRYQAAVAQEESDKKDAEFRRLLRKHYPEFEKHYRRFVAASAAAEAAAAAGGYKTRAGPDPASQPAAAQALAGAVADAAATGFRGLPPGHADERVPGPDGRDQPRAVLEKAEHYQRAEGLTYARALERIYETANREENRGGQIGEGHCERALQFMRDQACSWAEALYRTAPP
jgi:hypothetical protein